MVKQQFEDHKFQTKKQIQLINTGMIEAELKADELQKSIEDLENENKSLKTEVTRKSKKEIIHVEDTIKKGTNGSNGEQSDIFRKYYSSIKIKE